MRSSLLAKRLFVAPRRKNALGVRLPDASGVDRADNSCEAVHGCISRIVCESRLLLIPPIEPQREISRPSSSAGREPMIEMNTGSAACHFWLSGTIELGWDSNLSYSRQAKSATRALRSSNACSWAWLSSVRPNNLPRAKAERSQAQHMLVVAPGLIIPEYWSQRRCVDDQR